MAKGRRLLVAVLGLSVALGTFSQTGMTAMADSNKTYLDTLNVGVATIIDPSACGTIDVAQNVTESEIVKTVDVSGNDVVVEESVEEEVVLEEPKKEEPKEEEPKSTLVMADVQNALNVRAEANEESEIVGKLYKDCGGTILERTNGWTKLQSGNIVGWASDEYLLFDENAEALAKEVGNLIVTIETDALRVRKEPSTEAGVYGLIAQDDEMDVIEVVNEEWISVDYEGNTGYVSAEFVNTDFHIDAGETIEEIKAREKAEAEAKAKLTTNQGAVVANADDTRLLASLIQCEAGGESYDGMLAVGAVVMNRVRSGGYPDTITGVIYASGQFTPALNGKVARVYEGNVKESCMQAAQAAINGETNVGEATHFKRAGAHDGYVIGNHVFW
ncbi:MAG: cell wall hydrolase [Lachnospiraceae bacterium]|nr:cell wall hydrolase [Lachnospiraceae bacterium]